jgi:hypothetical protein
VKQWLIVGCALMVGAAGPARAWCEATCGAPVTESKSHCPTHDPADGTTALSASLIDDCPVPESARPAAAARLDVQAALTGIDLPAPIAHTHLRPSFDRSAYATTVFERCTPLRI